MSEEYDGVLQRVDVVYCDKCGMPLEYCEYGPDFETHCIPWIKKNHPGFFAKLNRGESTSASATTDKENAEEEDAGPTEPWTTEERLTAFYEKYQPDKLNDVPSLLEKYAGKEDKLFLALVKKYGPEPEDPYYAESDEEDEDEDEEPLEDGMENLAVSGSQKRRGAKAKKAQKVETRVVIQKEKRQRKKATTVIHGMDTVPGLKLKDVSKAFSKRFAGSSSVKDGPKGDKQIIIQGDHMEDVADMLVKKFKVPASSLFLDFDGDIVAYG